ncbi:MAG TPA: hypothetical protein PKD52_12015 [Clostridiales bacterium]|nr:hypothetical protein [Clostridiales bacterium]
MTESRTWDDMIIIVLNSITLFMHLFYSAYSFVTSWLIVFQTILFIFWLFINQRRADHYFFSLLSVNVLALMSVLINGGGSGSILVLFNASMMLYLSIYIINGMRIRKLLCLGYIALTVIWMFKSGTDLYNPNTVGLIAVFGVIFMDWAFSGFKMPKLLKIVLFSIFVLLTLYMVFDKSDSRNCIFAIVIYLFIVNLVPNKLLIKKSIYNIIFIFLTVGSLVWTKVLIYLYQHSVTINLFFSSKRFYTGREIIWIEVWKLLRDSWLFGMGTHQSLNSFVKFNLHNSMLNLLSAYGILTSIAFIILLYLAYKSMVKRVILYDDRFSKISLVAFITIMLHGFNELTLFSAAFLAPMIVLFSIPIKDGNILSRTK